MIANDKLNVILAPPKTAPAHDNHPVKYAATRAYFLAANCPAQKYCPPALGIADANSDSEIPTHIDMKAIQGMS